METFSALLALCAGNSPVTGEFPHEGQWRRVLMFSLICALNKQLSKQSWGWWFETPSCPLWRQCNGLPLQPVYFMIYFIHSASHAVINNEMRRVSALRPRRNQQNFADDIFKRIFFNETVLISINISLKFVLKDPINNILALVQI